MIALSLAALAASIVALISIQRLERRMDEAERRLRVLWERAINP